MKINPYDKVVDGTLARLESVSDKIARNFKGTNPFNKEPIKNKDLFNAYNMLSPQEMQTLVDNYGVETVGSFIQEMEELRSKTNA